eukprot:gene11326-4138_t
MNKINWSFFLFVFLNIFCLALSKELRINEVSALISYNSNGIILEVSGVECAQWSITDPSLLKLVPVDMNDALCSKKIRVYPNEKLSSRKSAIVFAKSLESSKTVKCEVFVDHIDRISVLTIDRKMVIGELENLEIQAFDKDGNTFTRLDGLNFEWSTYNPEGQKGALKLLAVDDTTVNRELRQDLNGAKNGFSTQSIIVVGLEVGRVMVSAKISDVFYSHLESAAVPLSVLDKLELDPSRLLWVVPGAIIPYKLKKGVGQSLEVVSMPNEQFKWSVSNSEIAEIDNSGVLKANKIGQTDVIVQDTKFTLNEAKGIIFIVKPAKLKFKFKLITDYDPTIEEIVVPSCSRFDLQRNLIEKHDYEVEVEVYDQDDRLIYITEHTKFEISIEGNGEVSNYSLNKGKFNLHALEHGSLSLKATLLPGNDEFEIISTTEKKSINSKVKIEYELETIHLPFNENVKQKYQVKATGGSGAYFWYGTNPNTVNFDAKTGTVTAIAEGESKIYVADQNSCYNGDSRIVSVSAPASINFVKGYRETAVASNLCLEVSLKNLRGNSFANFSSLTLSWSLGDLSIYARSPQQKVNHYCFHALSVGETTITAKLKGSIQDKTMIGAFPMLEIIPKNEFLVTLGSEIQVEVTGGPIKWSKEYNSEIKYSTAVEHSNKLTLKSMEENEKKRVYAITCKDFGSQQIKFTVDHSTSIIGFKPTKVNITATYHCHKPTSLNMIPLNHANDHELSPIPVSGTTQQAYNIKNNQTLPVIMKVYNENGALFDDISSLQIEWNLDETKIAKFSKTDKKLTDKTFLDIGEAEGSLILKGAVVGYQSGVSSFFAEKFDRIEGDVELRITSNLFLNPSFYLLFRSSKTTCILTAGGGSGKYQFTTNNTQISTMSTEKNTVELRGIQEGYVGVQVLDSQFSSSVESVIKISDIHYVKITGPRLVKEGEIISVSVVVMDEEGNEFDGSQIFAMQPRIDNNYISIATVDKNTTNSYSVKGLSPGVVKLVASVINTEGSRIFSNVFQVQVFSELKVEPSDLKMIPGAEYQISITGGPSEGDIRTFYSITTEISDNVDPIVAKIDNQGVITAINYGSAMVVVERVFEKETFARLIVPIYVVKLTGIGAASKISLYEGMCSSLTIHGESDKGVVQQLFKQSPNFGVSFYSENSNVATVIGSSDSYEKVNSAVVCANQIGSTEITIRSEFKHITLGLIRSTYSTKIVVEKKLAFMHDPCNPQILLAPLSTFKIQTNKNKFSTFKYILKNDEHFNIDQYGTLTAKNHEATSNVEVVDVQDNQNLYKKISVVSVHSLGIESTETGKLTNQITIPLGIVSTVKVIALSNMGEKLSGFNGVVIKERKNYQNLVTIHLENDGILKLKALKEGNTILELSSDSVSNPFYVRVTVFGAIKPVNPYMIIGDKISFNTISYDTGIWKSNDERIIKFENPHEGIALALTEGKTSVSFNSNQISTSTTTYISKISSISISSSKTSNYFRTNEQLEISVKLFDSYGNEIISNPKGIVRKLNIECGSTDSNLFTTEKYEENKCILMPTSYLNSQVGLNVSFKLYIRVKTPQQDYVVESKEISLKLLDNFDTSKNNTTETKESSTSSSYSTWFVSFLIVGIVSFFLARRKKKKIEKKRTFDDDDEEGNFQEMNILEDSTYELAPSPNSVWKRVNAN